jgi:hypothetical protein
MQNNGQGSIIVWPAVPADRWCGVGVYHQELRGKIRVLI